MEVPPTWRTRRYAAFVGTSANSATMVDASTQSGAAKTRTGDSARAAATAQHAASTSVTGGSSMALLARRAGPVRVGRAGDATPLKRRAPRPR
jgi:hypothetical protein